MTLTIRGNKLVFFENIEGGYIIIDIPEQDRKELESAIDRHAIKSIGVIAC